MRMAALAPFECVDYLQLCLDLDVNPPTQVMKLTERAPESAADTKEELKMRLIEIQQQAGKQVAGFDVRGRAGLVGPWSRLIIINIIISCFSKLRKVSIPKPTGIE